MEQTQQSAAAAAAPARPWRRRLWRAARIALLAYLGICIVFHLLQNYLMFPGHATQGQRQAVVRPGPDSQLLSLTTAKQDQVAALFGKALGSDGIIRDDAATRPTIVFFYGNGMCLADCLGEFRQLRKLGANVMLLEYPGYGMSGGKPGEEAFYAAADTCWNYLMVRPDIDQRKIISTGWSIGSGVAIDLAWRKPVAALATYSGFTSMQELAATLVPWLPARLLLTHKFENERKMAGIRAPALIVHGRGDQMIPWEMSQRLAKAAAGKATTLFVETDHNDLFELEGERVHAALRELIEQVDAIR